MAYRNGNYSAFYVNEPFSEGNLGAHATKDFVSYNLLRPPFLSSITKSSKAIREEIDYGINTLGLPVIVVYPEYYEKSDIINCESKTIRKQIKGLWDNLPIFRNSMDSVPTLHIPSSKSLIRKALENEGFMVNTKKDVDMYFYPC